MFILHASCTNLWWQAAMPRRRTAARRVLAAFAPPLLLQQPFRHRRVCSWLHAEIPSHYLVRFAARLWQFKCSCAEWIRSLRHFDRSFRSRGLSAAPVQLLTNNGARIADATSSLSGAFEFRPVASGSYVIKVPSFDGFALKSIAIRVPLHSTGLVIKLEPDRVVQMVNVEDNQAISTDPTANKDAVSYRAEDLRSIPIFDQDVLGALTPFLDAGSISSGGVSIVVDGVEMKGATVSSSGIAEVAVNNDPYSAEFGRPGRGRIEIATKPGTPQYHGELNLTTRDATFNANNYFSTSRSPEQRRIIEGNVTGPIGHGGHTTFLLSAESKIDNAYSFIHAIGPQGAISENVSTPEHDTEASLRVTQDLSSAHRLSVGYNFELDSTRNTGVGGLVLAEAGSNNDSREDDLIINDRIIVSPKIVNQFQITVEKDKDATKSVTDAPSIQISSSFTGGGAQADVARSENTIHISEVVSVTHRNHYLRFDANIPQISRRAVDDNTNRLGTFGFNALADYVKPNPTPYVFTSQQGAGRGIYWINEIGGFVQDQIRISPQMLLTLGLRYQWQTYISDKKNFAPRVSLAYSFNSKTILRVGSGIFFGRTGGDFPATSKLHNGVVFRSYQVLNPGYPNPLAPGQSITALPTNIVRTAANLRTRIPFSTASAWRDS